MRESVRGTMALAHVAICFECGRTEMRNAEKFKERAIAIRSFKKAGWSRDSEGMLYCAGCTSFLFGPIVPVAKLQRKG